MDDHFLRLSEDALDDSKAGERLILCRKAAEAFCKAIAKDGFPEKVEGNLGRMIQHLYARKLIESNHKVSLEIIRMWANDQSHDNPPDELALPQSLDNLRKLREWYRLHYTEKVKENGQTKIKESDAVEVRFKYYYDTHQNLKSEWFDGKKRYRLFGLSEDDLLEEWRLFRLRYLIVLQEIEEIVEREEVSREMIALVLSLDDNHICEIDSLWENDKLVFKLRNWIYFNESWFDIKKRYRMLRLTDGDLLEEWQKFRMSCLVTHFKFQEQIDKEKDSREKMRLVLSLDDKNICRIDSMVRGGHLHENLKPQIISNILALFQNDGQVFRFNLGSAKTIPFMHLFQFCEDFYIKPKNLQNAKILVEVPSEFNAEPETSIYSIISSLVSIFSPQMLALCTDVEDCETFADGLYSELMKEGWDHYEWPLVFPSGGFDLSAYDKIVDKIYQFEDDKLILNFPNELYKLIIMARAAKEMGKISPCGPCSELHNDLSQIIVEIDSLKKDLFNEDTLDWAMSEVMNNICSSNSLVSVISKLPHPTLFSSEIEDGIYHFANNRKDSDEYIETALNIASFVVIDGDSIIIKFPSNLSKSLSRSLVHEIEERIEKIPPSRVIEFVVNFKGISKGSHSAVEGFLHSFELFLQCYFPNEFVRKGSVDFIKNSADNISWVCEASVSKAANDGGAISMATVANEAAHGTKHCFLLTKKGLMTKFDGLGAFIDQYEKPNETILLQNEEWNSSHFYFSTNGRCRYFNNSNISWYPAFSNSHEKLNLQKDEKIACTLKINEFNFEESIVQCTAKGIIKKSSLNSFENFRAGGMISMMIDEEDQLRHSIKIKANDHILLLTKNGKGLRFSCDQLRNQGRATRGVRGIRLKSGDEVVSMLRVDESKYLLLVSRNGLFLKTKNAAFLPNGGNLDENAKDETPRKRGGQGVTAMSTEAVCAAIQVDTESEILIVTEMGKSAIVRTQNIRESNRGHKGVRGIRLDSGDAVQSVFLVP
ncbi:hypothetical protein OAO16_00155 [Opitutales bacterium]|nr:hypothetical protein [Opitutales bacterium]